MLLRSIKMHRKFKADKKKKEKKDLLSFELELKLRAQTKFRRSAEHIRMFYVYIVSSRFNYGTKSIRATILQPSLPSLLSSIVPHSDRHKVSSFVFVAEFCTQPPPRSSINDSYDRRGASSFNTYRRRYMDRGYQDSSTWNAFQPDVRHGQTTPSARFPLYEIRTFDSLARWGVKTRGRGRSEAQTSGWNRTIFAYRSAGWFATRQTIVRERHSSLEERRNGGNGGRGESSLRAGISAGMGRRSRGKESKSWTSFRLAFARPRLRADVGFNRLSASCASR